MVFGPTGFVLHTLQVSRSLVSHWLIVNYIYTIYYFIVFNVLSIINVALSASAIGLAISSAISLLNGFQVGVQQSTEVENQMTSVERVIEYSRIESEADLESICQYLIFNFQL